MQCGYWSVLQCGQSIGNAPYIHKIGNLLPNPFLSNIGQEVTTKEKKPSTKNMPKKNVKTKPSKQHQFPILKKVTKKEKLANIKLR